MFNLLLCDDEPLIRRGIKNLIDLKKMYINNVYEASTGEEAIELAKKEEIDLILMDINMPTIDGITASTIIKKNNPNIHIIILTGYDYFEYAQAALRAKVDDYILKPVSKSDIEYVLKNTVDKMIEIRKNLEIKNISGEKIDIESENIIADYFDKNIYNKDFSLNKMASDIGYSSNYLSVLIKEIYSIPFQEVVYKMRMEKAKILLLSTNMKNQEIADSIGIEDVNYFITRFKKYYNKTPKQYRQGIFDENDI